jgi:hypothetical protein
MPPTLLSASRDKQNRCTNFVSIFSNSFFNWAIAVASPCRSATSESLHPSRCRDVPEPVGKVGRARRPTRMGRDGLFGCAPSRPLDYSGSAGLLWAMNGGRLFELHFELHRDGAVIDVHVQARQSIFAAMWSPAKSVCLGPSRSGNSPALGDNDLANVAAARPPTSVQRRQRILYCRPSGIATRLWSGDNRCWLIC